MKIALEVRDSAASADLISETLSNEKRDTLKEFKTRQNCLRLSKKEEKAALRLSANFWVRASSNDVCIVERYKILSMENTKLPTLHYY